MSDINKKIQKLLALSKSSNIHEAELALQKATELMEQHQISQADLIPDPEVTVEDIEGMTKQHYVWAWELAKAAAIMFDCKILLAPYQKTFIFVGDKHNIKLAQMLFWHLFKAWKTICNSDYKITKPVDRRLFRKSHGIGYARSLYHMALILADERKIKVASTGTSLIVVNDAKIDDFINDKWPNMKTAKSVSTYIDPVAQRMGIDAGNKMNLNQPLEKQQ